MHIFFYQIHNWAPTHTLSPAASHSVLAKFPYIFILFFKKKVSSSRKENNLFLASPPPHTQHAESASRGKNPEAKPQD